MSSRHENGTVASGAAPDAQTIDSVEKYIPYGMAPKVEPTMLDAALVYTARDIAVFPLHWWTGDGCSCGKSDCKNPGKHPLTSHGFKDATTDEARIREWWSQWPQANIGVPTGAVNGFDVIDPDTEGIVAWESMDAGLVPQVRTGSGGLHVYVQHVEGVTNSQGKLASGIDVRGEGGYVVVPPSNHELGKRYEGCVPNRDDLPAWPPELLALALAPKTTADGREGVDIHAALAGIPDGERDEWLWRLACRLRHDDVELSVAKGYMDIAVANAGKYDSKGTYKPVKLEHAYEKLERAYQTYEPDTSAYRRWQERGQGRVNQPPTLPDAALYGLAGDIVRAIEPHTESDPAALLVQFLVAFGSAINRGPHFYVEASRHGTNLFAVLVGDTSKGRKGTSWAYIEQIVRELSETWRVASGLSSGEGLISEVRDPITKKQPIKQNGRVIDYQDVIEDHGVTDKRLLVVESEFASTLKVMGRDGNTLSAVIRNAWDTGRLDTMVKNNRARATDAHIAILGHITKDELRRYLTQTESGNGFANRFIWTCVKRSKLLPHGGSFNWAEQSELRERLKTTFLNALASRRYTLDADARVLWEDVYPTLSQGKPGLLGAVTARSEAQTMRLAMLYAVLDGSATNTSTLTGRISRAHLEAALALWSYADNSAAYIFGDATGDQIADRIVTALRESGTAGMSRTDIRELFKRNVDADRIDSALNTLASAGLVYSDTSQTGEPGRPATRWYAIA